MVSLSDKFKKHKLTISFLLIIVLFLSFGVLTTKGLLTLGDLTRTIYEHPLVVSNASLNAALNITKMHRSMKDVVLASFPDEVEAALKTVEDNEQKVYLHSLITSGKIFSAQKDKLLRNKPGNFLLAGNPYGMKLSDFLSPVKNKMRFL